MKWTLKYALTMATATLWVIAVVLSDIAFRMPFWDVSILVNWFLPWRHFPIPDDPGFYLIPEYRLSEMESLRLLLITAIVGSLINILLSTIFKHRHGYHPAFGYGFSLSWATIIYALYMLSIVLG